MSRDWMLILCDSCTKENAKTLQGLAKAAKRQRELEMRIAELQIIIAGHEYVLSEAGIEVTFAEDGLRWEQGRTE